ncbi:MAG: hypothetical protein R3F11_29300 [Verrucomicrobiales bacterium]
MKSDRIGGIIRPQAGSASAARRLDPGFRVAVGAARRLVSGFTQCQPRTQKRFMPDIKDHFHTADWVVLFGYLFVCTVVGHLMKGKQSTIRDFFLGGRSLPWPAVSGSIIATEISGVTFIGVPGMLFAMNGNFTYLQWAIGSIIARFFVARFFVRVYYEQEIYSPYDYMGARLGVGAKKLATILFTIGSILAQSVRVLVAAIALEVVTPFPQWVCIIIIGLFAVGWTLMGGMRTVIWTDVMQFVLFTVGGRSPCFGSSEDSRAGGGNSGGPPSNLVGQSFGI